MTWESLSKDHFESCQFYDPQGNHSDSLTVGIVVFIAALPVPALPSPAFNFFRLRRIANRPCDRCGKPFGRVEIERALDAPFILTKETIAQDLAQRVPARIRAYCPVSSNYCGAEYNYFTQNGKWERLWEMT